MKMIFHVVFLLCQIRCLMKKAQQNIKVRAKANDSHKVSEMSAGAF